MISRLTRTKILNQSDANTSRLFGLFAQNRRNRLDSSPRINDVHNESLRLDWNTFCYDIFDETPEHLSTWHRISQQILRLQRCHVKIAQGRRAPPRPLFDAVRIDGKFVRSFNIAMYFTLRALRIKGVSDENIARTQSALNEKQSQRAKDRQCARATQEAKHFRPSVKHHNFASAAPIILSPIIRSASLPVRSRRSIEHRSISLPARF